MIHSGPHGLPTGQKQPSLTEAQRNAEALFTTRTISEIREVEVRTRKDIEQKKLQLRNLVGDSYRDLIESADKILTISRNTNTILSNVRGMQEAFSSLAHNFTSSDALLNEKRDSLTKHEELYAVGSRVKYLVDTPELIWGCLDGAQYLEAARRFRRAEHVHELLHASFPPATLAQFPLLRHHWPTVTKFRKQVVDAAVGALGREAHLQAGSGLAADLLAALAALREDDCGALLQTFLTARREMLVNLVAAAAASSSSPAPSAAEVLSTVAQAAQLTVAQVGELFLPSGRGADATCLLQERCREDEADYSELLFGGRTKATTNAAPNSSSVQAPEAEAWKRTNKAVVERLAALSSGQVEQACVGWLRAVAEDLAGQCPRLLAGLGSAGALVEAEAQVRAAVAGWEHPGVAAARAAASAAKRPRVANTASVGGAAGPGGLGAEQQQQNLESWEAVCEWVVGRQLSLWQEMFHAPFVVRSRQLLDEAFAGVERGMEGPLEACLAAAAAAEPEPAGCVTSRSWPLEGWEGAGVAVGGSGGARGAEGATPAGTDGGDAAGERAYRQQVSAIQRRFDEDLRSILQAALLLAGSADAGSWPPPASAPHSAPVSASPSAAALPRLGSELHGAFPPHGTQAHHPLHPHATHGSAAAVAAAQRASRNIANIRRDMQGSRAAELEPYVQSRCVELVTALAARLQARLDALGAPRDGPAGAPAAEQVVLLGRLASALASDSKFIPVALGPPDGWRAAVASPAGAASAGGRPPPRGGASGRGMLLGAAGGAAASRLGAVLERLRTAGVAAYGAWARWAAGCLAAELKAAVAGDDLLVSNVVPLSWQETVIRSEAENALAEPVADMRFHLPASPSPSALLLLAAACAEVRRAGDTRIAPEALQIFEWELSRAAAAAYTALLQPGAGGLSGRGLQLTERGVLQLLFDVRFLRDVLLGGRPPAAALAAASGGGGAAGAGVLAGLGAAAGGMAGGEAANPAVAAALGERKREQAALEQLLQDSLDPIDWATYESHLWANVARYFGRVATLFGGLIQLQRAHPEAPGARLGAAQDTNPLNVLPVAPRFQYLPISAPIAQPGPGGAAGPGGGMGPGPAASRLRPSSGALGRAMAAVSGIAGSAAEAHESYSFADLGSARGRGAGGAAAEAAPAAAAAAAGGSASVGATAFSALQARLQGGSLGSFGSMLGDKAAEVTAMAQQRLGLGGLPGAVGGLVGDLGDYTSALGSAGGLLSSLAKNVVKK